MLLLPVKIVNGVGVELFGFGAARPSHWRRSLDQRKPSDGELLTGMPGRLLFGSNLGGSDDKPQRHPRRSL
jgi:hypothetical protein